MSRQAENNSPGLVTAAESMREELAALLLQRARIAAAIGIVTHAVFTITDWFQFHDSFVIVRLLSVMSFALLLALSYTGWGIRNIFGLVFVGFVIANISLALLIWQRDLFVSGWASGFFQIILAFCVFIPVTTAQAARVCGVSLVFCLGPALGKYGTTVPPEFATFLALLIGATVIVLVGRHTTNTLWEREFSARQELQKALVELQATHHQLVQSEKMAALGRLVAGVAHELNNSLSVISSNLHPLERAAQIMSDDTEDGKNGSIKAAQQTITHSVKLLHRGVERASAIAQNLRQYSTPSRGQYSNTDINEVVDMSVSLVATKAKDKDVIIHRKYGDLAPAMCDAQSLSQVFVNVLENACDAVAASGNIRVRTEMIAEQKPNSTLKGGGASILITIRDDGSGIPAEHLTKLFEPFFTTKPPGAGMGLGLAITRRIIEDHKGKIEVANASPGVIVSIMLPAAQMMNSSQVEVVHPLEQPTIRNA